MKIVIALILAGAIVGTQTGCAAGTAFRMAGPTNDEAVECGMHRSEVEGLLGVGAASQYEDHGKIVARYRYSDGPHVASRARGILYMASYVFTFFLSDIVFGPIELYANKRIERVGTAHYDGNVLVDWTISRPDGEILSHQVSSGPPDEASGAPDEVVPETPEM